MGTEGREGQVSGEYMWSLCRGCGTVESSLLCGSIVDELCRWVFLIESRGHNTVFIRILILPEQDCNKTELQTPAASTERVSLHQGRSYCFIILIQRSYVHCWKPHSREAEGWGSQPGPTDSNIHTPVIPEEDHISVGQKCFFVF